MPTHYTMLNTFLLLASALASPLNEDSTAAVAKLTKTIVIAETQTIETSMAPLPTDPSLTCPTPDQPCIVDGIPIWPNSTTVPTFSLSPNNDASLTTTMSSMATSLGQSVTSSDSKTATSTRDDTNTTSTPCSHSMSHFVPSTSTSWTTTITTPIDDSSTITPVFETSTPTPQDLDFQPSEEDTDIPPDGEDTEELEEPEEPNNFSTNMADKTPNPTTASSPTDMLNPITWAGPIKRSKVNSASRARKAFWNRLFVAGYPQTPVQVVRDEQDDFTSGNEPEHVGCVECGKGRDIVCIGERHYGFCDEGCAEPRRLREGMKCVDGRVFGERMYHE